MSEVREARCGFCHQPLNGFGEPCPGLTNNQLNPHIEAVLTEREKTHGRFETQAQITEELKDVINGWIALRHPRDQAELTSGQLQALDMIALKIGRIIAGDPNFADHWEDIAGYAILGARTAAG